VHSSAKSALLDQEVYASDLLSGVVVIVAALLFLATPGCSDQSVSIAPTPTSAAAPVGPHPFTAARVVRVIDSITIDVEIDGQVFRVRYLGVQVSDTPVLGADGASISERALQFNRFHLQSGLVELERDIMDTDTSDRLLRYVYVNGEMVNKALLTNGYATVASFPPDFKHKTSFTVEEERAKRDRRGVWSPQAPKTGAATQTPGLTAPQPFPGGTLPVPPGLREAAAVCDYSGTAEPVIKGNVEARTGERIYHVPGGFYYSTIAVEESSGDRWFCTEQDAVAAGWKKSTH
jgi:micrococcal nuclease